MNTPAPSVTLRRYDAIEAVDVHDFHQIVFGVDGVMEMSVEGIGARLGAGSAWLIPAGAQHAYAGCGLNRQLVLDLPGGTLAVPEQLFEQPRVLRLDARLAQLVTALANRAQTHVPASRHFHWLAGTQLCDALLDGQRTAPATGIAFTRIDRWLRAHLDEPLRIADLAAHCGLGVRRFHALFTEAFGETPHQYLNKLRLDTAVQMLDAGTASLTDIAAQTGFADQSAFTRAFSRRFGQAPGQWRAMRCRDSSHS
jgi:AraC-like DNA-binding protein